MFSSWHNAIPLVKTSLHKVWTIFERKRSQKIFASESPLFLVTKHLGITILNLFSRSEELESKIRIQYWFQIHWKSCRKLTPEMSVADLLLILCKKIWTSFLVTELFSGNGHLFWWLTCFSAWWLNNFILLPGHFYMWTNVFWACTTVV
jgi:hypothetical protein